MKYLLKNNFQFLLLYFNFPNFNFEYSHKTKDNQFFYLY